MAAQGALCVSEGRQCAIQWAFVKVHCLLPFVGRPLSESEADHTRRHVAKHNA